MNPLDHSANSFPSLPPSSPVRKTSGTSWGPLLALAVLLLIAPAAAWIFPAWSGSGATELRKRALAPRLPTTLRQLRHWPEKFDSYLNDNVPGRSRLIQTWSEVAKHAHFSSSPEVILGRDEWLFLRRDADILDKHRGFLVPSAEQKQAWQSGLKTIFAEIESAGGTPWLVIAPNKETVYPEFLPPWVRSAGPSTTDFILQAINEGQVQNVIDLRPVLVAAKPGRALYWKTDTHWNGAGIQIAYDAIMDRWERTGILPSRRRPETFLQPTTMICDLTRLLGAPSGMEETGPELEVRGAHATTLPGYQLDASMLNRGYHARNPDVARGKLLILGDSFSVDLCRPMQESFREIVYAPHDSLNISRRRLREAKADVVLIMIVERLMPLGGPVVLE
jgi:alginate O-acetyltransferase complex protein AlgJ